MAYGLKYRYTSDRKMLAPGVYEIGDADWIVRIQSIHKGATGRNGVKTISRHKSKEEAETAFALAMKASKKESKQS